MILFGKYVNFTTEMIAHKTLQNEKMNEKKKIICNFKSAFNRLVPELFGRAEISNRRPRNRALPFYFFNSMLAGKTP